MEVMKRTTITLGQIQNEMDSIYHDMQCKDKEINMMLKSAYDLLYKRLELKAHGRK